MLGEYVVIPTFSVYPSNSLVQAFVSGGKSSFIVSDGGGAARTLTGAGAPSGVVAKLLKEFSKASGVKVNSEGWLYVSGVPLDGITSAMTLIIDATLDAAWSLLRRFKPAPIMDFRRDLDMALKVAFRSGMQKRGHLVGASNKVHTFDYLLQANDNVIIALDAVVRDASSVNAAVVAHLDVRATQRPDLRQFIIYDDMDDWDASDLALLTVGAPSIAYTKFFSTVVEKFVAA